MLHTMYITAATLTLISPAWSASLLVSHYSGSVFTLKFNSCGSTPGLSVISNATGCGVAPSWLELHHEDKKLWCFDESPNGTGFIASYDVARDGRLVLSTQFQSNGYSAHGTLYGGPKRRSFIATAEYVPSTITTYGFPNSSGNPVLELKKFSMTSPGPNPRQNAPHPHEVILDPTGNFILVPDLGADLIRIFRITQSTGLLTSCGAAKTEPGEGPRHGKWWTPRVSANSIEGLRLYVLNELANSVSSWTATYQNSCITLTKTQTISTFASGAAPNSVAKASELRIFGNFLYAANRADETFGAKQDSIAAYTIDAATGNLTWIEATNAHAYFPRTFQINKAGNLVAVGGQTSSNVAIISRDIKTGKLGDLLATVQVATPGRPNQDDGLSAVLWNE